MKRICKQYRFLLQPKQINVPADYIYFISSFSSIHGSRNTPFLDSSLDKIIDHGFLRECRTDWQILCILYPQVKWDGS